MKNKRKCCLGIAAALLACLGVAYRKPCLSLANGVRAMTRSTNQFVPWAGDPRVLYEPGAEESARVVAEALPEAIRTVEERQYGPFARPVRIHVCASIESFKSYGANERAGGVTINQRLFISPKPENTAARLPGLVTHELSHLHLEQHVGALRWLSNCPVWFQEGLAVYVSDGCGAEKVSEQQARAAIAEGKSFHPESTGSLLSRKGATAFGLSQHLFYRQSGMFVAFLHGVDETSFKTLLLGVKNGKPLDAAFESAYGEGVDAAWQKFVSETNHGR